MTMRRASIGTYGTLATVAFVLVVMVTAGMFGIGFSSRLVGGGTGEISSHGSNAGSATPLATPVAAPNHGILDKAYLRAVHLVPDAPAVDVWVNGAVVFSDLSYQGSTAYASMSPGAYTVSVTAHGTTSPLLVNGTITLAEGTFTTAAFVGNLSTIQGITLLDSDVPVPAGSSMVRFVAASNNTSAVDVNVSGAQWFANVSFGGVSAYATVPNGTYDLDVNLNATGMLAVNLTGVTFNSGEAYTVYLDGTFNSSLGSVVLADGQSTGLIAGQTSSVVTVSNVPTPYWLLPYTLNWNVSVTNGTIGPANTWISVSVLDVSNTGACVSVFFAVGPCATVANMSVNSSVAAGVTSYSLTITNAMLTASGYNGGVLPEDQFAVFVWFTLDNGVSNVTTGAEREPYIVPAVPTGGFIAPLTNVSVSTGNVTVGVNYTGNYITGAQLSIFQGTTATGKLVYSQGLYVPGGGAVKVVSSVPWTVATAGPYYEQLNLTTPYGDYSFNGMINVVAAGGTVYQNSSSWSNSSAFGGTSPGALAAGLLVVGLIIGMIVALALGRAMWGSPKTAPAQAWQAKPSNECSVCHQSFATEAELKEHAKTAHGM
jgi:Domain of unknown function (DUF4397)